MPGKKLSLPRRVRAIGGEEQPRWSDVGLRESWMGKRGPTLAMCLLMVAGLFVAPVIADAGNTASSVVDDEEKGEEAAPERFDWTATNAREAAEAFLEKVGAGDFEGAYASGTRLLAETRDVATMKADLERDGLHEFETVEWDVGVPAKDGVRLTGTVTLAGGDTVPIYVNLLADEVVAARDRTPEWYATNTLRVLDVQTTETIIDRIASGALSGLDVFVAFFFVVMLGVFVFMVWRYVKGLLGSPRELYLMFFTKVTEYSAYGAATYAFVLYLSKDVGLGDSGATAYYTVFSLVMTVSVMVVGAVCDTIGIKKTLLIGAAMLITSRFFMPLTNSLVMTSLLGFLPMAMGIALTGPVLKVGIKKFTTVETATLGFGLFYTLMNVGYSIGGWLFDHIRERLGDGGSATMPIFGVEMSTYQVIFAVGLLINIPDLIAILLMREGAEMTESGFVIREKKKVASDEVARELARTVSARRRRMLKELTRGAIATAVGLGIGFGMYFADLDPGKWGWAGVVFLCLGATGLLVYALFSLLGTLTPAVDRVMFAVRDSTEETGRRLAQNFKEKPFWIFLFLLGVLVFVRLTFFIFHVMFPTYAIRVFGEGAPVGSLFGVLNPVLIVFLVPLFSVLTMKVRSYTMLLVGTLVSAGAVFLCFLPEGMTLAMANSFIGELVFDYWLDIPIGQRDPFYLSLITFIVVFTVGEAIWSPRLMQFSAEIAPHGKEGSYLALAILPYFLGKALAGGMSGFLLTSYTPETASTFPDHQHVWLWIGGMAMISPVGLIVFRKLFRRIEADAIAEAKAAADVAGD
jgi:dipeptide/tripeptide permease